MVNAYDVQLTRAAQRAFDALPETTKNRIERRIDALSDQPRSSNVTALAGGSGRLRVRIGDYRIIFEIDDEESIVLVIAIGHRGEVYRQ